MDLLNGALRIFFQLTKRSGSLGKVRFWAGEFWYFFPKKVLALPGLLIEKTPDPPPLGD